MKKIFFAVLLFESISVNAKQPAYLPFVFLNQGIVKYNNDLVLYKVFASTYHVRTDGSNSNNGLTNSSGGAWLTNEYAFAHATSGDLIITHPGTYTITGQLSIPVGISWEGTDSTTCIIKSTYSDTYDGAFKLHSTAGTNGNQHISFLKFDGQALATGNGIFIDGRSNVQIYDCSFRDFQHSAIIFNGEDHFTWDVNAIRATGNAVYNCTINNCAGYAVNGDGCLQVGRQRGFLIHHNTITQTARASGTNGWPVKYYADGYLDSLQIYNNTFIKKPYAGDGTFDFAVELWHIRGLNFHDNIVQGSLDLNFNEKGSYPYCAWVHNNTFSQATQNSQQEAGIYFEFSTYTAIVEDNSFSKISTPLVFVPRNMDTIDNFIFRRNKCVDLGVVGNPDLNFVTWYGSDSIKVNNYHIENNTFVGLTGGDKPYSGLKFLEGSSGHGITRDSIYIQNNIVVNNVFGGIQFSGTSNLGVVVVKNNNTYGTSGITLGGGASPTSYTNSGNISSDPLFVGSGNYTLQSGSPSINTGANIGYPYVGIAPDMGYAEYGYTGNYSPSVSAGSDQIVYQPATSTTLTGTAIDYDGTIVTHYWRKLSGSGTITDSTLLTTTVTGLTLGTSYFELRATDDSSATGRDTIQIKVRPNVIYGVWNPAAKGTSITLSADSLTETNGAFNNDFILSNQPLRDSTYFGFTYTGPVGDANIKFGIARVNATLTGQPQLNDTSTITLKADGYWTRSGGFNGYTSSFSLSDKIYFAYDSTAGTLTAYRNSTNLGVMVSGLTGQYYAAAGNYFTASTITLLNGADGFTDPAPAGFKSGIFIANTNISPTANAGTDLTSSSTSITLTGSGSDVDGSISSYAWTKISGTGGTIVSPSSSSTSITGLSVGNYTYRLTVTDNNGATGYDDIGVTITVSTNGRYIRKQYAIIKVKVN